MPDQREGLDLTNLEETTPEEVNAHLMHVWSWRGPLYEMYTNSLMLDYAPDFAKLHRWGSDLFGRPVKSNVILLSAQNIHSYMMLGWETGIRNEFITLHRNGMPIPQIMELVMFSQLYAGMRGLGHVYRAIGDMLASFGEPPGDPAPYPEGWAADPPAFRCGLDLSTRQMTDDDQRNLRAWYEQHIGFVPSSIEFGLKHHPDFVKVYRAKWEAALKTVPKQMAPYLLLRHHTITGSREGLREATLLGKSWGITSQLIVQSITSAAMYFTGFEGLYAAHDAVDDLLDG
jgi:hypothetical protein